MTTRETAIDLTSDDEDTSTKRRRMPVEDTGKADKKMKQVCGVCEENKDGLRKTGNSIGLICEDCVEDCPECGFCDGCNRYEETDGENLCGRCQHRMTPHVVDSSSDDDSDDV